MTTEQKKALEGFKRLMRCLETIQAEHLASENIGKHADGSYCYHADICPLAEKGGQP